ncbi:hypothetical protein LJR231_005452 [Phyllobacterium sp. LjRoot231]|uniref:hypothetical protein n=1 Tax=Phyllobacterium sp. LjRoot231 TaxID=3342289 RepID=UPI003ECC3D72
MADETHPIRRLQLMLRDTCCTDDARAEAKRAAQEAGMKVSGEGNASLSARMSDAEFRKLFPAPSGSGDTLAVPERLKPFVESISEAPEHLSFE